MSPPLHALRQEVCNVCRWAYDRGWLSATDGNVSVRVGRDRILSTPSGVPKGFLKPNDLVLCDLSGRRVAGRHPVTTEMAMHVAVYEERPDVNAVVHMHPTYCIAFSVAGQTLAQCLLPEVVFTFGVIPTAPYSAPTTDEVPAAIKKYIHDFDAMILERHGSLTVGTDLMDAYMKLERMEHVAEITHRARQLGDVVPLTPAQVEQLQEIGESLGLPPRPVTLSCEQCNACPNGKLRPFEVPVPPAPALCAPGTGCENGQGSCGGASTPPVASTVIPAVDERVMQLIAEEVSRAMTGTGT